VCGNNVDCEKQKISTFRSNRDPRSAKICALTTVGLKALGARPFLGASLKDTSAAFDTATKFDPSDHSKSKPFGLYLSTWI
jgi:hypothetical protein